MKKIALALIATTSITSAFSAEITNESEAGIAVASGNTKSKNYNVKQSNAYTFDANTMKFDARYLNSYSNNDESARYIFAGLRYERSLSESFSLFVGQGLESDKFAGYYLRHSSDIGIKYNIIKAETFYWLVEGGYRYTNEKLNTGVHGYKNTIRTYTELEKKWNPSVSTKYFVEYLPNIKESKDYQINTELSLSAALTNVFSIKSAYLLRYDHMPAATASTKTDTLLTTALVAKF